MWEMRETQRAGREMAVVGLSALAGWREPLTLGSVWFKSWLFHLLTEGSWMSGHTTQGLMSCLHLGNGAYLGAYTIGGCHEHCIR